MAGSWLHHPVKTILCVSGTYRAESSLCVVEIHAHAEKGTEHSMLPFRRTAKESSRSGTTALSSFGTHPEVRAKNGFGGLVIPGVSAAMNRRIPGVYGRGHSTLSYT